MLSLVLAPCYSVRQRTGVLNLSLFSGACFELCRNVAAANSSLALQHNPAQRQVKAEQLSLRFRLSTPVVPLLSCWWRKRAVVSLPTPMTSATRESTVNRDRSYSESELANDSLSWKVRKTRSFFQL